MSRTYVDYIIDMLQAIDDATEFTYGKDYKQLEESKITYNAVLRCIQVLGQAASRIPDSIKEAHSEIPWQRINSFRNKIVHDYDSLNSKIIMDTIRLQLPEVKKKLEMLKTELLKDETP